jgi:hypothetical protein
LNQNRICSLIGIVRRGYQNDPAGARECYLAAAKNSRNTSPLRLIM